MWLFGIKITLFFALCRAHGIEDFKHNAVERSARILELDKILKQNPPKCREGKMICEVPEFEYPAELITLTLDDYINGHQQEADNYQHFLIDAMLLTGFDHPACDTELEEIYLPGVAFSARNESVYIVQREPYTIKKIAIKKCMGSKDRTIQCREHYDMKKILTLDINGTMGLDLVKLPFGCDTVTTEEATTTLIPF